MITDSILSLIGNTPMLRMNRLAARLELKIAPLAKLECLNPAGSAKDRPALFMIEEAEKDGLLQPGATIIEPTSGNTGVGLSMVCTVKGYKLILTMPDTMSKERISLLRAHGAEVVLTEGSKGMTGSVAEAERLHDSIPGSIILGQFENPSNPLSHYKTTAEEILSDCKGIVDAVVAGMGTGGTICGTGRKIKEVCQSTCVVAVEPASSPLLSKGISGPHKLQGIGGNFIPQNYDAKIVDVVMDITDEDAIRMARLVADTEGLLIGFTSGGALCAACKVIEQHPEYKNVVVILPDGGERYLSTDLYGN